MHYNKIRKMDISNGIGVRVSIFLQGCDFHCPNCFNSETWDFNGGNEFTDDVINHILELCDKSYISGLSILGGEPLHPKNIDGTLKLCKEFKSKFHDKTIWIWTGFLIDKIINKEILNYIDVLVDGQFKQEEYDPNIKWRGSKNQRVIDVQKTLKHNKIIVIED